MKIRKKSKNSPLPENIHQEQQCLNCGHSNEGAFCSNCGQNFSSAAKPIKDIFADVVSIFSLDSSIFQTIIPFLFKPGFLSREYLDGRRKKYLSPIKLYLFMSILFFFVAGFYTKNSVANSDSNIVFGNDPRSVELNAENPIAVLSDSADIVLFENDSLTNNGDSTKSVIHQDTTETDSLNSEQYDKLEKSAIKAADNEALFVANLMKNISYSLFFLMPVFALILKLFYIRRKRFYVEHLIFSINFHSFTLLILTIIVGLNLIFKEHSSFADILLLVIPVYCIIGMMRFYKQGFFKTFLKAFLIGGIYTALLLAALSGLAVLTVATF